MSGRNVCGDRFGDKTSHTNLPDLEAGGLGQGLFSAHFIFDRASAGPHAFLDDIVVSHLPGLSPVRWIYLV